MSRRPILTKEELRDFVSDVVEDMVDRADDLGFILDVSVVLSGGNGAAIELLVVERKP